MVRFHLELISQPHLAYSSSLDNWHCPTFLNVTCWKCIIFGPLVELCWSIPIHEVTVAIRMAGQPESCNRKTELS